MNNYSTATVQVNVCQPVDPVNNWSKRLLATCHRVMATSDSDDTADARVLLSVSVPQKLQTTSYANIFLNKESTTDYHQ